ncbi:hypothetical protein C8R43DRAFT_1236839 [Mycena crocata]|nr:hypothetical protein C8R43DRAFT_1236839 [Mycena crocata]
MPTELLSLIFVFTYICDKDPAPWMISQVCRPWRAIVSSSPSFWKSVILDFSDQPKDGSKSTWRLETHLQRSENLPLNILFICGDTYQDYTDHELAMLRILAEHCGRWEKVQMLAPPALYSKLAGIRGRLPLLRELNLQSDLYRVEDEAHSIESFELAPELQQVSLNLGAAVTVVIPFSRLLRYVSRSDWDNHTNVLLSASNLVECGLNVVGTSLPPTTTIALPNLLRLSLSKSNLLEYLNTPNLQELYCRSSSEHLSSLCARRPFHRLQKLVLPYPASVTDLAGILRQVPTITKLGLSVEAASIDALATLLTIRNQSTDVAPALQCINICYQKSDRGLTLSPFRHSQPDLVIDMVESRWGDGHLRSITYSDPERWMRRQDDRAKLFETQGLKIRVASGYKRHHLDMIPSQLLLDIHR